jgi:hypothetical protein
MVASLPLSDDCGIPINTGKARSTATKGLRKIHFKLGAITAKAAAGWNCSAIEIPGPLLHPPLPKHAIEVRPISGYFQWI